ncbi:MAG: helix-turn-helix domain-containing protein, partial [Pseudonocardia sp.]
MLVAFRLAHGWSQSQVAEQWNDHWPDEPKTFKSFSCWENWLSPTGHEPSLRTLDRLAQLYECSVGDLLSDRADYRHLDKATQPVSTGATKRGDVELDGKQAPDNLATLLVIQLEAMTTPTGEHPPGSPREREEIFDNFVRFLTAWGHTVRRRDVLQILASAAPAAVAALLTDRMPYDEQVRIVSAIQTPSRIDTAVIGDIEEVLRCCMRQDKTIGPQAALDTVLVQRNLVRTMLPECPAALRPQLLSLFSALSRYAGWCSFDLTDFDSAWYYYEQARLAAHEAANTELGTLVLCNMSYLATWLGRPRLGIDHAVAAQAWATRIGDAPLQAYTFDVAACAYAFDGQRDACLTELKKAGELVATSSQHDPVLLSSSLIGEEYGPGRFASTQSMCFLQLADTAGAMQAASTSLKLLDDTSDVRNVAFTKFDLVGAYTQSHEINHAAELLGETAELVTRNRSVRLVRQLHDSRAQLEPWKHTRAIRALDDKLQTYGLVSGRT